MMIKPWAILNTILFAAVVATTLGVISLNRGIAELLSGRMNGFTTSLVLRAGISTGQAFELAQQIQQNNGATVTILTEADARAQLALQDPWMENLPEVEIARLPLIIQVQHTDALNQPEAVTATNEALKQMPAVEFIIFSDHEFESVTKAALNIRWYSNAVRNWIVAILGIVIVVFSLVSSRAERQYRGQRLAMYLITGIAGAVLAHFIFKVLIRTGATHYPLPNLSWVTHLVVTSVSIVSWLLGSLITAPPAKALR